MNNSRIYSFFTIVGVLMSFFLIAGCSSEQKPPVRKPPPLANERRANIPAEIKELEALLLNSYLRGDTLTLQSLIDDDYTIGLPTGEGFGNKRTEIGGIKGPIREGYVLRNDTMEVKSFGDVAIVTKLLTEHGTYDSRQIDVKSLWTNTWVKRNAQWRLIATHGTYIPMEE